MTSRKEDGYNKLLPTRIREMMEKRKIKQKELADKTGIARQSIGYYADGSNIPNAEVLAKIAKALDVSSDYLLGLSEMEKPPKNITVQSYGDAERIINQLADAMQCVIEFSYGSTNLDDTMGYDDLKEIGTNDILQCYISFRTKDTTLFEYYSQISKSIDALTDIPNDVKEKLISAYRKELLKTLDKKLLPHSISISLENEKEGD